MTFQWWLTLSFLVATLAGCGTTHPYYLVESKLVESDRRLDRPDVTETSGFATNRGGIRTLGLQPPDVCADQGLSTGGGTGQLQLGVLRTRCGVEMAELERALTRAGFRVVSWGAVQHMAAKEKVALLEAATDLGIDALLQVNALERIEIRPGRDARFERRFYRASRTGERAAPARVESTTARAFESLIEPKEAKLATGARVGATINVSAVDVKSGATIWFYEWTQIDEASIEPQVTILVDCDQGACREIVKAAPTASSGPVEGSISGVSVAGDPADEMQAIFHDLVRSLVTDLAERFAGQRS
jgi:hypothetical protein